MMFSNVLLCPISSAKPKQIQFTIIEDKKEEAETSEF